MTIAEIEDRLCLLSRQRSDLLQARAATGKAADPDWSFKEIKPISDEIDRLDHSLWIAREQEAERLEAERSELER